MFGWFLYFYKTVILSYFAMYLEACLGHDTLIYKLTFDRIQSKAEDTFFFNSSS